MYWQPRGIHKQVFHLYFIPLDGQHWLYRALISLSLLVDASWYETYPGANRSGSTFTTGASGYVISATMQYFILHRITPLLVFAPERQFTLPYHLACFQIHRVLILRQIQEQQRQHWRRPNPGTAERLHGLHYRWQHCRGGLHVVRYRLHHRNRWRPHRHWRGRTGTRSGRVLRAAAGTTAATGTGTTTAWVHVRVLGRTLRGRDHEVHIFLF